jgi:hypothetical protein
MTDFYFWMDKEAKQAIEERKRYKKFEKPPMKVINNNDNNDNK